MLLKTAKRSLLLTARNTGLFNAIADSEWRRRRLLIIAFHSIALDDEHQWRRPLFFTRAEFADRLALLQHWQMNVLPLDEGLTRLHNGTLPRRSVALTFDDGSVDFSMVVWPLLKRLGLPGTVYPTTYYGEKRLPIFPMMCSYLLWKGRGRRLPAEPALGLEATTDLSNEARREETARRIIARAEADGLTAEEKDARLGEIADLLGVDYVDLLRRRLLQLMTPEELRQVAIDGADVQLHTHRHRMPPDGDLAEREIMENVVRIEAATGRPARHFCYPSGVYYTDLLPRLKALGLASATTCVARLAQRNDQPLLLPRLVDTASLGQVEVEGWLSGFSHFLLQRRVQFSSMPTRPDTAPAS